MLKNLLTPVILVNLIKPAAPTDRNPGKPQNGRRQKTPGAGRDDKIITPRPFNPKQGRHCNNLFLLGEISEH